MMQSLRELFSFVKGEESMQMGERGVFGVSLTSIAVALATLFGIGIVSAVSIEALLGMLVVIVIAVGGAGAVLFDIPFKWTVYLSIACLAVVAFVSLGKFLGFALAIIGIVAYFLPIKSRPVVFGGVIAFAVGAAVLATAYAPEVAQIFGAETPEIQQMVEGAARP